MIFPPMITLHIFMHHMTYQHVVLYNSSSPPHLHSLGVPVVAAKKATEQVPFELRCGNRVRAPSISAEAERSASVFKARPMPSYHESVSNQY